MFGFFSLMMLMVRLIVIWTVNFGLLMLSQFVAECILLGTLVPERYLSWRPNDITLFILSWPCNFILLFFGWPYDSFLSIIVYLHSLVLLPRRLILFIACGLLVICWSFSVLGVLWLKYLDVVEAVCEFRLFLWWWFHLLSHGERVSDYLWSLISRIWVYVQQLVVEFDLSLCFSLPLVCLVSCVSLRGGVGVWFVITIDSFHMVANFEILNSHWMARLSGLWFENLQLILVLLEEIRVHLVVEDRLAVFPLLVIRWDVSVLLLLLFLLLSSFKGGFWNFQSSFFFSCGEICLFSVSVFILVRISDLSSSAAICLLLLHEGLEASLSRLTHCWSTGSSSYSSFTISSNWTFLSSHLTTWASHILTRLLWSMAFV